MQIAYHAANLLDAHLVRHALEHAGIPAFVRGEALVGGIGDLPACELVSVAVPESAWEKALEIVEQLGFGPGPAEETRAVEGQGQDCPA